MKLYKVTPPAPAYIGCGHLFPTPLWVIAADAAEVAKRYPDAEKIERFGKVQKVGEWRDEE